MEVVYINEVRKQFVWKEGRVRRPGWVSPDETRNPVEWQDWMDNLKGDLEIVEFYACPLCGGESNSPLGHLLDAHTEALRIWQTKSGWIVRLPGEAGLFDEYHRMTEGFERYVAPEMVELISAAKAWLAKEPGCMQRLKAATKALDE